MRADGRYTPWRAVRGADGKARGRSRQDLAPALHPTQRLRDPSRRGDWTRTGAMWAYRPFSACSGWPWTVLGQFGAQATSRSAWTNRSWSLGLGTRW